MSKKKLKLEKKCISCCEDKSLSPKDRYRYYSVLFCGKGFPLFYV